MIQNADNSANNFYREEIAEVQDEIDIEIEEQDATSNEEQIFVEVLFHTKHILI
jgi:hypothetical protein